jgi:hypothetical protein
MRGEEARAGGRAFAGGIEPPAKALPRKDARAARNRMRDDTGLGTTGLGPILGPKLDKARGL